MGSTRHTGRLKPSFVLDASSATEPRPLVSSARFEEARVGHFDPSQTCTARGTGVSPSPCLLSVMKSPQQRSQKESTFSGAGGSERCQGWW
jgi:hypothetical protein